MFAEAPSDVLLSLLDRPDLRVVAADRHRVAFDPTLDAAFRVRRDGRVVLGGTCLGDGPASAFHLRHALELSLLLGTPGPDGGTADPTRLMLAAFCAARVAARFWGLEAAPAPDAVPVVPWIEVMGGDAPATAADLASVWCGLRHLHEPVGRAAPVPEDVVAALGACWALLGPVETLMATGGDGRLRVDGRTGLNHYGCSHRPRPWAITFASSTASSLSERGFAGAEAARQRVALAALDGRAAVALAAETERTREALAAHWALGTDEAVVLAASGTDLELLALAVMALPDAEGRAATAIDNLLVAPEETGTGVPLAAAGRHFATDTARGFAVPKGELVAGFPADVRVVPVPIRDAAGRELEPGQTDRLCREAVLAGLDAGRSVLAHRLDVSKTGVLAPGMDGLLDLRERFPGRVEVVVDACQARLDPERVRDYLRHGWMVMVTGSKFFTGPPFCGALLLPAALAARLRGPGRLPSGLAAYGGAADWPPGTTAAHWEAAPNPGMVLRWQAALAEMRAFAAVPADVVAARIAAFVAGVDAAIAASPHLHAVAVAAPERPALAGEAGCWDRVQTIRCFLVLRAGENGAVPLAVAEARRVYRWLNADLSAVLPAGASAAERELAGLLCHVGQPAPVADDRLPGVPAGALRLSVGARLISGEPSHAGMDPEARLRREIADAGRVPAKIALILRFWAELDARDPEPRFASVRAELPESP